MLTTNTPKKTLIAERSPFGGTRITLKPRITSSEQLYVFPRARPSMGLLNGLCQEVGSVGRSWPGHARIEARQVHQSLPRREVVLVSKKEEVGSYAVVNYTQISWYVSGLLPTALTKIGAKSRISLSGETGGIKAFQVPRYFE